ncbi:hypothetical protein M426DRAFT_67365, partial [Hypoxylon sp. CI-4A]
MFESSKCIFRSRTRLHSAGIWGRHVGTSADLELVKAWIGFCNEHHDLCRVRKGAGTGKKETKEVPGFRLIDCETKKIEPSSLSRQFVALSYVWGSPANIQKQRNWPQVVEDAINVTKNLGYRYLWVDRYCIDQTNTTEKHKQVAEMHTIYQCSELTIIAAAGTNTNYGLKGISRKRDALARVTVDKTELLQMPQDALESIRSSQWWSRGWTYQEGVLSRRRIVFTKDQVYYEC